MSDLLKKAKFPPYPPCAAPQKPREANDMGQPPQINSTTQTGRLQTYLRTLHELNQQQRQSQGRDKTIKEQQRELEARVSTVTSRGGI